MKFLLQSLLVVLSLTSVLHAETPPVVPIPDNGWHLWPDTQATWKDDVLYLPDECDLSKLPVNPPTGGWDALTDTKGITVTLPSTVEQHFWGKLGSRPYDRSEYTYANSDPQVSNGAYQGVSWWWRDIDVPASYSGKVAILSVRGARQRAEVYVNEKLVGYNIIAETSWDCDVSAALRPGATNRIAIRITNPGGRYDWIDYEKENWGTYQFQKSHGFGGLDRGISLAAHDPSYLADVWILNTPKLRTVTVHATVRNTTAQPQKGNIEFQVKNPESGEVMASQTVPAEIPASSDADFQTELSCDKADLWQLNSPHLYAMHAEWKAGSGAQDDAEKSFGFRWIEPRKQGDNAGLYFNGQRIRLYTAISWGFWGLNGLWPTPDLAKKEVSDAKRLGMNMLNFHRDIGKEDVLAEQDKQGLLRYMEPGGGGSALGSPTGGDTIDPSAVVDTSGNGADANDFTQRYEEAKILRMIRQFRSHPSLAIYVVQNEMNPVLARQPRVFNLLRKMHELDPSRVIALKSGISPKQEAWYAPYDDTVRYDAGTGVSGWRDQHTVGGPGIWKDSLYKGPDHFTHQIDDRKEIVDWGEMLGAAVGDNHALMVKEITDAGGESYDLKDHQEAAAAYHDFLDKWGFRKAFPTDDAFFTDLGNKCYEFWGKVDETARLCESNDILTMSGWESTAIENHSGLVDNLRNFKGDPDLIASKLAPLLPVAKPHGLIHTVGDAVAADLYLLNETGSAAHGQLHLSLVSPSGKTTDLGAFPAPDYVVDQFVYPLKMGVQLPALTEQGAYHLNFTLDGDHPAHNTESIFVYAGRTDLPAATIGLVGGESGDLKNDLSACPQIKLEPYKPDGKYDLVIATPQGNGRIVTINDGSPIRGTDDDTLYRTSLRGGENGLRFHFDGLPAGPAKVSLYFCELEESNPRKRLFDLDINGANVLRDFDIFKEAGGKNIALTKTFPVNVTDGAIDISVPRAAKSDALVNAIKIEAGGQVIAVTCGGESYTDKQGLVWKTYSETPAFPKELLGQVRLGLPLLVIADNESAGDTAARQLSAEGAFQYTGLVNHARASWMGSWVFLRKHPLFDGLPSDEIVKADYQIDVGGSYGLCVDGPGVQILAAYGRDHDRNIGACTFTSKLGNGTIVFQALPLKGMQATMKARLIENAVSWLSH